MKITFTTRAWLLSLPKVAFAIGLFAALLTQSSWAAQQGSNGLTSSGNVDIALVSGLNVLLTGLADMPLGTWSGAGDLTAEDNLCVGRSGIDPFATGNYRIHASGDGEPGDPAAFTLYNGARSIHYDAYFNDATGIVGRQQLTPGVALTGQTGPGLGLVFNLLFGCFAENANISIVVPASELSAASGFYAGTLALMLVPE